MSLTHSKLKCYSASLIILSMIAFGICFWISFLIGSSFTNFKQECQGRELCKCGIFIYKVAYHANLLRCPHFLKVDCSLLHKICLFFMNKHRYLYITFDFLCFDIWTSPLFFFYRCWVRPKPSLTICMSPLRTHTQCSTLLLDSSETSGLNYLFWNLYLLSWKDVNHWLVSPLPSSCSAIFWLTHHP